MIAAPRALGLTLCALLPLAAAAQEPTPEPVPVPSLVGMEAAVQEQLRGARADLDAAIAEGPDRVPLARAFGDVGRLYLAYDLVEPAAATLKAGTDLACTSYAALHEALERKLVTEADLDRALSRVLRTRFRLGLFAPHERPGSHHR